MDKLMTEENYSMDINKCEKLLSPSETAKILGVSEGTLTVWRSTGKYNLPFVKVGRVVMYNPKDINNFIERRTVSKCKPRPKLEIDDDYINPITDDERLDGAY